MNLKNNMVSAVLMEGKRFLKDNKIEQFSLDAELFLMKILGFTKVQLFTRDTEIIPQGMLDEFATMLEKRVKGVPTKYILGSCEFMGLDFVVNPSVLIPRPDTEVLVERVLYISKQYGYKTFIDMCTGSGCIAVSLAKYGDLKGMAADISKDAIEIANINAQNNKVTQSIEFFESNLFSEIKDSIKFDIVVSNPPYIETEVVETLMTEVKDNEPSIALDGGKDGLDFYKQIAYDAKRFLNQNGILAFEIGYNQGLPVKEIMENNGFVDVQIENDLAGLNRVVFGFIK